uniref:Uncharacterized protein n=1 Tax=Lates calcarifer TaxID=8187 RepID=A0A4W6DX21_LATCA
MAACFTLRSTVLRRALRGALSLHGHTPGLPNATARLRLVCNAAAEEKKSVILESTEEYKFVERLIPPSRVPTPPKHAGPTPSGWTPPADSPPVSAVHDPPICWLIKTLKHSLSTYKAVSTLQLLITAPSINSFTPEILKLWDHIVLDAEHTCM